VNNILVRNIVYPLLFSV